MPLVTRIHADRRFHDDPSLSKAIEGYEIIPCYGTIAAALYRGVTFSTSEESRISMLGEVMFWRVEGGMYW